MAARAACSIADPADIAPVLKVAFGVAAVGVCRRAVWLGGGASCCAGGLWSAAAGAGATGCCEGAGAPLGWGRPGRALSRIFFSSLRSNCGALDCATRSLSEIMLDFGRWLP